MIKRNSYSITLLIVSVLISVLAQSQQTAVKASVDKKTILIGEQINLRIEADIPGNQPIRFFHVDSLPHFEILEQQRIDTADTDGGTGLSQVIRITSWDSGHWVIPQFELGGSMATDSIGIDVGYTPFDTAQPYHDIKAIIEVKPEAVEKKDWKWKWIIIGALIFLAQVYILIRGMMHKQKEPEIIIQVPLDVYKTALAELEKLKKEKTDARIYYTRLVDIFRTYIHDKKGIHSMQQTTDDLVLQLRELKLAKEQFDRLAQSLRMSDFVKFAKYVPTQEDDRTAFDVIKSSIDSIEQMQ
jgi:hypothetical protein